MASRINRLRVLGVFVAGLLLALGVGVSSASASSSSWWSIDQNIAPANVPHNGEAFVVVTAANIGYGEADGSVTPITITDTLPAGLEILNHTVNKVEVPFIEAESGQEASKSVVVLSCTITGQMVSCPYTGKVRTTESVRLKIAVKVNAAQGTSLSNRVEISGGGSTAKTSEPRHPSIVGPEETALEEESGKNVPFAVDNYELQPENADGTEDNQAGSHPFQLSTTFDLSKTLFKALAFGAGKELRNYYTSPALAKNLHFLLPQGLIGNVAHMPQCSGADFNAFLNGGANLCPGNTAIGVGTVTALIPGGLGDYTAPVPIFNLVPDRGEPARFGFEIHSVPVVLTTKVRSGSDYAVEVSVHYATEAAAVINSQVVFWGVPGDPRHDASRGWNCIAGGFFVSRVEGNHPCEQANEPNAPALLSLPTVCPASPAVSTVTGESWPITDPQEVKAPEVKTLEGTFTFGSPFTNCDLLPFEPTIEVQPESTHASSPTGMNVSIKVPQASTLSAKGLAEADIKNTKLVLPLGMTTNGGSANNLQSCTANLVGFTGLGEDIAGQLENDHFSPASAECPEQAKVGTVKIVTPLLEHELTGSVYLAHVNTQPFSSPLVLYITAEDPISGVIVKLAGSVSIDEHTGQLTSEFNNAPPLPFSELKLHLFEGEESGSTQATPPRCGTYKSEATFLASTGSELKAEPEFTINSGPTDEGGACPSGATLPFSPSFKAGAANTQGGAFSAFSVVLERADGNQPLKSLTVHEPAGLAAELASVTPCPSAIAESANPSCPASSQVGESTAYAGDGTKPVAIGGKVYLTGPVKGAPFGLLSVTEAEHVGPFDLGNIPVLSTITVDPETAAATITSDPIPEFAPKPGDPTHSTGVPSQIKKLVVNVNKEGFTFNPTNCDKKNIVGVLGGWEGGVSTSNASFQATNCGSLPFKPTIEVSIESAVSRSTGTGLQINVHSGPGQANIGKTKLEFPTVIPSRITTLQKSCRDTVFDVNPAGCSPESIVGTGTAHTPVLKSPLTGPIYLVSHANAAFPDAVFVLQGEGIKLILDGKTDIEKGITSSSFESVPDAPVTSFEVSLPRSTKSAFSGYGNLCTEKPVMPTYFTGQNGATIQYTTKINVTGCGPETGVLPSKKANELAKNLKICAKIKNKSKRAKCVASAHRRANALASCKKVKKGKKRTACETKARKKNPLKTK